MPAAPAPWYRWDGTDLVLQVVVQPRASRDAIAGVVGANLKIRLTAPPVEGRANEHLIAFLAELFGTPRSAVILEHGSGSRRKRLRVKRPRQFPPQLNIRH